MEISTNNTFTTLFPKYKDLTKIQKFSTNEKIENFIKNELPSQVQLVRKLQNTFNSFLNNYTNIIVKRPQLSNLSYSLTSKSSQLIEKAFKELEIKCQKLNKQTILQQFYSHNPKRTAQMFKNKLTSLQSVIKQKYINNTGIKRQKEQKITQCLYRLVQIYYLAKSDLVSIASKHQIQDNAICEKIFKNQQIQINDVVQGIYLQQGFEQFINSVIQKRCRPFYNKKDYFNSKIRQIIKQPQSRSEPNLIIFVQSLLSKQKSRLSKSIIPRVQQILRNIKDIPEQKNCKDIMDKVQSLKKKFIALKNNTNYIDIIRGSFTQKYKMQITRLQNLYYLNSLQKYLQDVVQFVEEVLRLEQQIIDNRSSFKRTISNKIQSQLQQIAHGKEKIGITLQTFMNVNLEELQEILLSTQVENNYQNKEKVTNYKQTRKQQQRQTYNYKPSKQSSSREQEMAQKTRIQAERRKARQEERANKMEIQAQQRRAREQERKKLQQYKKAKQQEEQQKRKAKLAEQRLQKQKKQQARKLKQEQERKKRADELTKKQQQLEQKKKIQQQRKRQADEIKKKQQQENKKRQEEQRNKKQMEKKKRQEEQSNRKKQMQQKNKLQQEKRKKKIQEQQKKQKLRKQQQARKREQQKTKRQEEQRKRKDAEQKKKIQQQQKKRKQDEEKKKKQTEQKRKLQQEQRKRKQKQEQDKKRKLNEQNQKKQAQRIKAIQLQQAKKKQLQQKLKKQQEQRKLKQAEEKKIQQQKKKDEQEKQRKKKEMQQNKRKEEQEKRIKKQQQERKRKEQQQEQKRKKQKEQKQKKQAEARKKQQQQKQRVEKEKQVKRLKEQERKKKQAQQKQAQQKKKLEQASKKQKKSQPPKRSAINYGNLDDQLIDEEEINAKKPAPIQIPNKNKKSQDQYLQEYDDDFDDFSPQKQNQGQQAQGQAQAQQEGGQIDTQKLIQSQTVKSLNDYIKGTSYSRKNKPNLQVFNNLNHYLYIFEQLLYNQRLYIFSDPSIAKAISNFSIQLQDQSIPQQQLSSTLDAIHEYLQKQLQKFLGTPNIRPQAKLVFPFPVDNEFNIYQIIIIEAAKQIVVVLKQQLTSQQGQNNVRNLIQGFIQLYSIEEPQLLTVVVQPDSKAVLDTFDKQIPNLLLSYALHYEQQHNFQAPIVINQYTIQRFFYTSHILEPFYKAIQEQQNLVKFFEDQTNKFTQDPKIKIFNYETDLSDPDYQTNIVQVSRKFKQQFINDKNVQHYLVLIELINPAQEQEEVQFKKIVMYMSMSKEQQGKPTLNYYIVYKNQVDQQNQYNMFELTTDDFDNQFQVKVFTDFTRHNGQSEYSNWTLSLWAHIIQKKKMNPVQAYRVLTLAMTPYYLAYKQLD